MRLWKGRREKAGRRCLHEFVGLAFYFNSRPNLGIKNWNKSVGKYIQTEVATYHWLGHGKDKHMGSVWWWAVYLGGTLCQSWEACFSSSWITHLIPKRYILTFWGAHHSVSQEIIIKGPHCTSFKSDGQWRELESTGWPKVWIGTLHTLSLGSLRDRHPKCHWVDFVILQFV